MGEVPVHSAMACCTLRRVSQMCFLLWDFRKVTRSKQNTTKEKMIAGNQPKRLYSRLYIEHYSYRISKGLHLSPLNRSHSITTSASALQQSDASERHAPSCSSSYLLVPPLSGVRQCGSVGWGWVWRIAWCEYLLLVVPALDSVQDYSQQILLSFVSPSLTPSTIVRLGSSKEFERREPTTRFASPKPSPKNYLLVC